MLLTIKTPNINHQSPKAKRSIIKTSGEFFAGEFFSGQLFSGKLFSGEFFAGELFSGKLFQ
ncbi:MULTISPECIES: hypothetical protein [unclassified Limnothrix]|uniref:hypothetical protein n=1 Tax=Limnothrix sp. FACHB-1088 TaxID=2692816 RepID=UPI001F5503AE|nr:MULTISPECIES: hypothetical protein [unclassified Limnothrix]